MCSRSFCWPSSRLWKRSSSSSTSSSLDEKEMSEARSSDASELRSDISGSYYVKGSFINDGKH